MTESTQLQTADNNNAGVVKMEPPTPAPSTSATTTTNTTAATTHAAAVAAATAAGAITANSPPAALMEQLLSPHLQQQHLQQQLKQQQQPQQQQYALKWNDFQSSILNSFRHLRDEEDFVDVTLACDQRSFTAHKVVLSACSPYFRKLLKANPCDHPIVILRDIPSDDVENLLSFMYNGEVNVSHEHLSEFLKTAHLLQIRGLADVSGSGTGSFATPIPTTAAGTNTNKSTLSAALTNPNSNKLNFLGAAAAAAAAAQQVSASNAGNVTNLNAPFTTPAALAAVASTVAAAAAAAAANSSNNSGGNNNNHNNNANSNTTSSLSNSLSAALANNANSGIGGMGGNSNTPAIQELKASASASASPANHHWDLDNDNDSSSNNNNNNNNNNRSGLSHLTPPPQKRIKSADLFRAQHGISPERLLLEREFPVAGQHPLTRERRNRDQSRDRTRELEIRDSLLGQALENSNGQQSNQQKQQQHGESLHAQSAGEDSNSSDTEPSDRGDVQHEGTMDSMNGSIDNQRSHSFPSAFLGLQGLPGLLPGPSGIGGNDFVSRRSLEMRVRATDPRPCPKCGKIYRSAHTLRTHLEDKHTVCPGYRCVLCGTVAKSRNSLHSHMSRQHRGISTKDLPVLPMPSPFDPELASRLLAKAGVKISPAELRARASPTGGSGGGGPKLDLSNASGGPNDEAEDSDDDPEDLTTGNYGGSGLGGMGGGGGGGGSGSDLSRYHESLLSNFGHARLRNDAVVAAAAALGQKDLSANQMPPTTNAGGQSLLDTYLQFITENTFGIPGISQEHAAAAALHAAKMAQLNAIGHHGLDKLPAGLLPPQFDLAKLAGAANFNAAAAAGLVPTSTAVSSNASAGGLTIEPVFKREMTPNENGPQALSSTSSASTPVGCNSSNSASGIGSDMAGGNRGRDHSAEPMDLGLDPNNQSGSNNDGGANSDADDNYSDDEGGHHT